MAKYNWTFVYSEGHSHIMDEAFFRAFTDSEGVPGIFRTILYINRSGLVICYVPKNELLRVRQEGEKFFNSEFRKSFQRAIKRCADQFESFLKKFNDIQISKCTDRELSDLFDKYVSCLIPMLAHYQVSGGRVFPLLEEKIRKVMELCLPKKEVEKSYGLALTPTQLDILEREEIDLRKLAERKSLLTNNVLRWHAMQYSSKYILVYDEQKIFDSLRKKIDKLRSAEASADEYREEVWKRKQMLKSEQRHITRKLKKNLEAIDLVKFIREQGWLRFEYKEWFMGAEYKFLTLFKEIAKRIGIGIEEFFFSYGIEDVRRFLQKGTRVSKKERRDRMNIYVLFQDKGKKHFFVGKKAEKAVKELMGRSDERISEVRGVIASRGRATGKVKVILPRDFVQIETELKHFNKGEILITTMTQPNLAPAMKKAAAIVTDQGGMTSHAAVISREFNIPCIVGTYKATRVFKDGDLVEVDAQRGVVKLLKKAK